MTDRGGNIDRLPKWARERILYLERDIEDVQSELREVHCKESRITFGFDHRPGRDQPDGPNGKGFIPDGEHVKFWVSDRHHYSVSIGEDRKLRVSTSTSQMFIQGGGSNSIELTVRSRDIEVDIPEHGDADFMPEPGDVG